MGSDVHYIKCTIKLTNYLKFMKKLLLIVAIALCTCELYAGRPGCDWWVRTNGVWGLSHTNWYTKCDQMSWFDPSGNPISILDVQCCDFDAKGNYTGTGINCGFRRGDPSVGEGVPVLGGGNEELAGRRMRPTNTSLHGNWAIDGYTKIAINADGDVIVHHSLLSKFPILFNLDIKYANKPITVSAEKINEDEIQVMVTPLEGKTNKLDTTGSEYIVYNMNQLKKQLYEMNATELVNVFPNPVKIGSPTNLSTKLTNQKVEVYIYAKTGMFISSYLITDQTIVIDPKIFRKDTYFYTIIIDGIRIKGGQLAIE
jgi:hypothetical protein